MILRCSISRVTRNRTNCIITPRLKSFRTIRHGRRIFSTTHAPLSTWQAASGSAYAPFGALTSELDKVAPRFEVQANEVTILREPEDFYEALKTKILSAKRRIFISTLYIGKTEHELISTLRTALRQSPILTVSILTDYLRGVRESPDPSCASLLSTLAAEFGDRIEIRMFHTPNLAGLRKAILPKRINEGWGLQHMKLYGFDDEVMLSGANLSNDYFTNRQDRYHLFSSEQVTRFYERIHDAVCGMSYELIPGNGEAKDFELDWPASNDGPSPLGDPKGYIAHATRCLTPLITPSSAHFASPSTPPASQTLVYPIFQFTPLFRSPDPSTELPTLTLLLRSLSFPPFKPARWTFTAGYFNMTPTTRDLLLSSLVQTNTTSHRSTVEPQPYGTILTAHPHANGFYGSAGVSGMLPPAYTLMARRFLEAVRARGMDSRLSLREWRRGQVGEKDGWTYHAKGLWVTLPPSVANDEGEVEEPAGPSITVVGSSNYTKRSHTLDLEANALVVTTDRELQARLRDEEEHLMRFAGAKVGMEEFEKEERRVGWRVRVALWITNVIGGAL